jgi:hypothetical protein
MTVAEGSSQRKLNGTPQESNLSPLSRKHITETVDGMDRSRHTGQASRDPPIDHRFDRRVMHQVRLESPV